MNGDLRDTLKGILHVGMGNVLKVLSGVLVGFALPALLSVNEYGFVRTCTLYATYVGLFSTGLIDGLALRFGGTELAALERAPFRRYSRCFLLLEGLFALGLCLAGLLCGGGDAGFALVWLAVFLLTNNITSFCQTLSQITGRFRELSRFTQLQSLLSAATVGLLWLGSGAGLWRMDARAYLLLYTLGNLTVMLLYLFRWRELVLGEAASLRQEGSALRRLIRTGVPLMLANLCTLLILSADRQCVNVLCDTATYAVYAFAYNIVTMITMVIAAVSTVLFPTMKRMDRERLLAAWPGLITGIPLLVFLCLAVYFPLVPFIGRFLPAYTGALSTLRIVFPGLAASSAVTIVVHNYDKTLGLSDRFCLQSMAVLALSVLADLAVWAAFRTTAAISVASVAVLLLWYLITAGTLRRRFGLTVLPGLAALLCGTGLFYLCTMPGVPLWLGFLLQLGLPAAALLRLRGRLR